MAETPMKHVVLLGDSVFDNVAYVGTGLDVQSQLRRSLSADWQTTLLAKDGSLTDDVATQLKHLPSGASHLIVSAGGNNAIGQMGLLETPVRSVIEAVALITSVSSDFSQRYEAMVQMLLSRGLPITVRTIYYPRLSDPTYQQAAMTALGLYNDCIIRAAVQNCLSLLDLRFICTEDADFSHEIEPSAQGGAKIAAAIERILAENQTRETLPGTRIYV